MGNEPAGQVQFEILVCPNEKCRAKNAVLLKDLHKPQKCRKCATRFTREQAASAAPRDAKRQVHRSPNLSGRQLGHFKLLGVLGTGAMGVVYRAQDTMLQRDVAVKVLPRDICESDPKGLERFLNEARTAAQLVHPNVVQIFHIAQAEGNYFIAMEYVRGGTCERAAALRGGRLEEPFALEKMLEAADALAMGHRRRIFHRDIKPANLLLTTEGLLKVADFGLALWREGSLDDSASEATIVGTPQYLSPEQARGLPGDSASDVYSLGATFFRLFTGQAPFKATSALGYFQQHLNAPVPNPLDVVSDLSADTSSLLQRCLAKNPGDRPTAVQVAAYIRERLGTRVAGMSMPPVALADSTTSLMVSSGDRLKLAESGPASQTFGGQSNYLSLFGLQFYPFNDVRNPNLFWNAGPYAQAIESAGAQVDLGFSPVLLVGETGTGRSFLASILQKRAGAGKGFLIQPRLISGARLLATLCKQAGEDVPNDLPAEKMLAKFAAKACDDDRKCLVVIDEVKGSDAGLLAELRPLIQYGGEQPNLTVLLVGLPDLPDVLTAAGIPLDLRGSSDPVVVRPLSFQELDQYLDYRMQVVGRSAGKLKLTPAARRLLHARSAGIPRLINIYCHNALTLASFCKTDEITVELMWRAMQKKAYVTNIESLPKIGDRPGDVWRRVDLLRALQVVN